MKALIVVSAVLVASGCNPGQEPRVIVDAAASVISNPRAADNDHAPKQDFELRGRAPVAMGDGYWYCDGYYCKENPEALPEVSRLLAGNKAFLAGDTASAIEKWQHVIDHHPDTPAWNMAILNSGRVLRASNRHVEAVAVLKLILADANNSGKHYDHNKHESTPMESYVSYFWNNDWYDSCAAVSQSYEALGDFESAARYAILSRDQFWYEPICSMDGARHNQELGNRIASLEQQIGATTGKR